MAPGASPRRGRRAASLDVEGLSDALQQFRDELRRTMEDHRRQQEQLIAKFLGSVGPGRPPAADGDSPPAALRPASPSDLASPASPQRASPAKAEAEASTASPASPAPRVRALPAEAEVLDDLAGIHSVVSLPGLDDDLVAQYRASKSRLMFTHLHGLVPRRWIHAMEACATKLDSIKEPKRSGFLAELRQGRVFNNLCVAVIALNALFICFYTNAQFLAAWGDTAETSTTTVLGKPVESDMFYWAIDFAFLVFYSLELAVKLAV